MPMENSSMLKAHNEFVNVAEERIEKLQAEVKQLRGLLTDAKYVIQNNYPPMNGKKVLDRIEELLKSNK